MRARRWLRNRRSAGLATAGGHRVWLDDGALEVVVEHSSGTVIRLDAAGRVLVQANSGVTVDAPQVTVNAPMTRVNGMLHAETLIASVGVVSPSYTPGAGNVM